MELTKKQKISRLLKQKPGLYRNIHLKRLRGGKPRKVGSKGSPSRQDFVNSAKTAKKNPLRIS